MRTGGEHPTAEHSALALYLLGALDDTDRVAFEAHLAGCGECLSAAGEMGSVTSALGGLAAADWDDLGGLPEFAPPAEFLPPAGHTPAPGLAPPAGPPPAADPDVPAASAPVVVPRQPVPDAVPDPPTRASDPPSAADPALRTSDAPRAGEPVATVTGADPGAGVTPPRAADEPAGTARRGARRGTGPRADAGSPVRNRPSGNRPGGDRPGSASATGGTRPDSARRRRMLFWGGVAAALVAVVLAGGVAAVTGFGGHSAVVLTATGEAPAQGVSLSVAITTDEGRGSTIRITATGLRQGLRYRLFAVTRDGVTHVVRDWTASTGPQEVTGELSLPVADLAFVTVGLVDGTAVVTAPISR
ncbi:zf-HC2 domain-containing protein [Micromonospora sp. NPDC049081]|uniref:zf-HC2 domain-containing protein n=1 Tax=Micromonospora sp. NPDC049081 TaxID=3155150 RepID=UPI0033F2991F